MYGGDVVDDDLYIAPTLLCDVDVDSPIMKAEIFGPILPIIKYNDLDKVLRPIRSQPKILALCIFSADKRIHEKVLAETSSGGVAINDAVTQFVSMNLPFGGVGNSGMGRYHDKYEFETFAHQRAVMKQTNMIDLAMKYPPVTEKSVKIFKMILK